MAKCKNLPPEGGLQYYINFIKKNKNVIIFIFKLIIVLFDDTNIKDKIFIKVSIMFIFLISNYN